MRRLLLPAIVLLILGAAGLVIVEGRKASSPAPSASPTAAPARIADLWYAHNAMAVMLGAAPHMAMTVQTPQMSPWMFHLAPQMAKATHVPASGPTPEALLAQKIDLVFANPGSVPVEAYQRAGLHVVPVSFKDTAGLLKALDTTAKALDTPLAHRRAEAYRAYLKEREAFIAKRLTRVPENARPRVLHVMSLSPLVIDGGGTMIDEWIRLAGGRNAARSWKGGRQPVSIEQVAAWNPDVIVVGGHDARTDLGALGPVWKQIKAVRTGRVYRNPWGIFAWDRYGTEFALQLDWAAKVLHPELFRDTDMIARAQSFYQRFFGFELTTSEVKRILAGQPPA